MKRLDVKKLIGLEGENKEKAREAIVSCFETWCKCAKDKLQDIRIKLIWRYFEEEIEVALSIEKMEKIVTKVKSE